jgi:acyl-CoA reductase-like NAD-dependent aldehyde dehydrogenase
MDTIRPFLVGGLWRESNEVLEVRSPFDGTLIGRVALATETDADDAVAAAKNATQLIRQLSVFARTRILSSLYEEIGRRADTIADLIVSEGGKTRASAVAEVSRARETIQISAEEARRIGGEIVPLDWNEAGRGHTAYVRRVSIGPVLAITPFNFPLNLACHKIGPAIAAGNPVILKPATATPLSALVLGEMLLASGIPPGAVSVLPCRSDVAERMARDPRIALVSFTGSPAVGWHLHEVSRARRVTLELGGNAAVIVHQDADLPYAAERIAYGGFSNAGQICISVQRVFLHRPVYDEALDLIAARVRAIRTGDPQDTVTDMGPMISSSAADGAMDKIMEAVKGGAEVLCGGTRLGNCLTPTVLSGTTPDMAVNRTEVFAPVITVSPYDDFDEALLMANATDYGLQMGVFTSDIGRVFRAFASADVGGLIINDVPTFRADHMPYGGIKGSGISREGPRYAIEEMTERVTMVINLRDVS